MTAASPDGPWTVRYEWDISGHPQKDLSGGAMSIPLALASVTMDGWAKTPPPCSFAITYDPTEYASDPADRPNLTEGPAGGQRATENVRA